mmetsp:Transcript_12412/g.29226  ORF Transcript_12412/g.29226 Transcript_12412/m.29226 type:complete len:254 (-) Transcript_12412:192-953(-)
MAPGYTTSLCRSDRHSLPAIASQVLLHIVPLVRVLLLVTVSSRHGPGSFLLRGSCRRFRFGLCFPFCLCCFGGLCVLLGLPALSLGLCSFSVCCSNLLACNSSFHTYCGLPELLGGNCRGAFLRILLNLHRLCQNGLPIQFLLVTLSLCILGRSFLLLDSIQLCHLLLRFLHLRLNSNNISRDGWYRWAEFGGCGLEGASCIITSLRFLLPWVLDACSYRFSLCTCFLAARSGCTGIGRSNDSPNTANTEIIL